MNRETKFRAFVKPLGEIHDVIKIDWFNETVALSDGDVYAFEDTELLQFTGLKDRNGKEIYEGDVVKEYYEPLGKKSYDRWYKHKIIKLKTDRGIGTQTIAKGRYQVDLPDSLIGNDFADNEYHKLVDEKTLYSRISIHPNMCEVIRNIHENPELLNQEAQ